MHPDEKVKADKKREAAREEALYSLSDRVIGKDPKTGALNGGKTGDKDYGRVRIWDIPSKQYVTVWPIDAAEMIANGSAILDKPAEE